MRRPIWAFAGRTYHIVGNLMSRLIKFQSYRVNRRVDGQLGWQMDMFFQIEMNFCPYMRILMGKRLAVFLNSFRLLQSFLG